MSVTKLQMLNITSVSLLIERVFLHSLAASKCVLHLEEKLSLSEHQKLFQEASFFFNLQHAHGFSVIRGVGMTGTV